MPPRLQQADYRFSMAVRLVWVDAWAELLQACEAFFVMPDDRPAFLEGNSDDDFLFDKAACVQAQPRDAQPFYAALLDTQMFAAYVDAKVRRLTISYGALCQICATIRDTPDMSHFGHRLRQRLGGEFRFVSCHARRSRQGDDSPAVLPPPPRGTASWQRPTWRRRENASWQASTLIVCPQVQPPS